MTISATDAMLMPRLRRFQMQNDSVLTVHWLLPGRGTLHVTSVATPARPPTAKTAKRSKVEIIKEKSDYLRHPLMQVSPLPFCLSTLAFLRL